MDYVLLIRSFIHLRFTFQWPTGLLSHAVRTLNSCPDEFFYLLPVVRTAFKMRTLALRGLQETDTRKTLISELLVLFSDHSLRFSRRRSWATTLLSQSKLVNVIREILKKGTIPWSQTPSGHLVKRMWLLLWRASSTYSSQWLFKCIHYFEKSRRTCVAEEEEEPASQTVNILPV